ncbi:MAG: PP2C family protein-serine/threonine phosphatase, partial [Candidatus Acidiferrales bacterium]
VLGRNGSVTRLSCGGQALGILENERYEQGEITLAEGDRVALFTDGITEVSDGTAEEFGEARLLEILQQSRALSASDIQKNVLSRVAEFSGEKFQDDATLILLAVG